MIREVSPKDKNAYDKLVTHVIQSWEWGEFREKRGSFIKIEPSIIGDRRSSMDNSLKKLGLVESKKSLFTKYNFLIDLTKSEDQLLAAMHPKTRYNIGVAQKRGVQVYESVQDADFETYLNLYFETTKRQRYFGHTPTYHRLLWETLMPAGMAK